MIGRETGYGTKAIGKKYTESYRVYVTENGKAISPVHDIKLKDGDLFNAVNEIPRFENAKFEISKADSFNPIKQDVKKGNVRFVANMFPAKGYIGNYGAFPETYEDPEKEDVICKAKGDNDPLDLVEVGQRIKGIGEVYKCKILGCLAMIDDNEADWKVIVVDSRDPLAEKCNDIEDLRRESPGLLETLYEWFRDYKKPDGKGENRFGLNGEYRGAEFAREIVEKAHASYNELIKSKTNKMSMKSRKNGDEIVLDKIEEDAAVVPESVGGYFYRK
ncbi:IPYR [Enterospora canceri]|uniref:inorganic diphosphatase n=1 Tax=Enterospora canceri TaxID=1081671 RepID=A0A1Y1S8L5_9MICR|nr:IPYR [Enterospora canceri]